MEFRDFLAQFDPAYGAWAAGTLPSDRVASEVARLDALAGRLDTPDDQRDARRLLVRWQSEATGAAADRMERASAALTRASSPEGSPAERTARAHAGIAEIGAIAQETTDPTEQHTLLELNGSLARLIESLR